MQDNTAEDLLAFFDNAQLNSRYWITFAVMSAVVMFDFFDFLVVGYLLAAVAREWHLTYGQSAVILYSGGTATILGTITDPVNFNPNLPGAPPTPQGIPQPVYSLSLNNVTVKGGDYIDFVTAPNFVNGQSIDYSSGTFELATIQSGSSIQTTPEPASCFLAGAGLVLLGLIRKDRFRRRK